MIYNICQQLNFADAADSATVLKSRQKEKPEQAGLFV